jgi:deoxyribodipyrimidine photo-lyase
VNDRPVRPEREIVLYWMIAARRLDFNFALERAVAWCRSLGRPLVILEALRCGYRWASDRHHRFVLDGMADHRRRLEGGPALYHPYVEASPGEGRGLLEALGRHACVVVTDDWPCFFHPRMVGAAARRLGVRLEAVDSNGLLPMRATSRVFLTAQSFRRFLQGELPTHLRRLPSEDPLAGDLLPPPAGLPGGIADRWPAAGEELLSPGGGGLARLPIDHGVPPVPYRGGPEAGAAVLASFLEERLPGYSTGRSDPDAHAASGLSPWLHFGHVSAHRVFGALASRERWTGDRLSGGADGRRSGWWGMGEDAEAFLDQLVTWRELGLNRCALTDDYDRYDSLPPWARDTLEVHAADPREHVYDLRTFEEAATHDELWNAAQRQLRTEGRIHNYLRMLWGKKILEWTEHPRDALRIMLHLNDRWAVDGRDPNSYSGIFWCLGRYDRGWPQRPVFGKVRSMSSEATRRKVALEGWLERWRA